MDKYIWQVVPSLIVLQRYAYFGGNMCIAFFISQSRRKDDVSKAYRGLASG